MCTALATPRSDRSGLALHQKSIDSDFRTQTFGHDVPNSDLGHALHLECVCVASQPEDTGLQRITAATEQ